LISELLFLAVLIAGSLIEKRRSDTEAAPPVSFKATPMSLKTPIAATKSPGRSLVSLGASDHHEFTVLTNREAKGNCHEAAVPDLRSYTLSRV
jgi:hypothetical protein